MERSPTRSPFEPIAQVGLEQPGAELSKPFSVEGSSSLEGSLQSYDPHTGPAKPAQQTWQQFLSKLEVIRTKLDSFSSGTTAHEVSDKDCSLDGVS